MGEEVAEQQTPPPPSPAPASSWPKEVRVDVIDHGGGSSSASNSKPSPSLRLWRVPKHVRDINKEAYGPKFVCIGPYHRLRRGGGDRDEEEEEEEERRIRVEKLKERYLDELLTDVVGPPDPHVDDHRTKRDEILLLCTCRLREMLDSVRRFYAEEEYLRGMTDEEMVRMLLHDGCFIIKHIYNFTIGYDDPELYATRWTPAQVRIDLGLLENQIPFFVLEEIFYHLTPQTFQRTITRGVAMDDDKTMRQRKRHKLIVMAMWYMLKDWFQLPTHVSDKLYELIAQEEVHHLLHLLHKAHVFKVDSAGIAAHVAVSTWWQLLCCVFKWPLRFLMSLLLCLCMCCCRFVYSDVEPNPMEEIASAAQLRALGVNIRRVQRERGGILDVRLHKYQNAILEIPQLFVNQATMPLLQNLVAYEQLSTRSSPSSLWWVAEARGPKEYFTMYAFLMSNLVRTTEDITVLQAHGVLFNNLGSHQSMIDYFQNLCYLRPIERSNRVTRIGKALHELTKISQYKPYRDRAIQVFVFTVSAVVTLCTIVQTIIAIIYRKS